MHLKNLNTSPRLSFYLLLPKYHQVEQAFKLTRQKRWNLLLCWVLFQTSRPAWNVARCNLPLCDLLSLFDHTEVEEKQDASEKGTVPLKFCWEQIAEVVRNSLRDYQSLQGGCFSNGRARSNRGIQGVQTFRLPPLFLASSLYPFFDCQILTITVAKFPLLLPLFDLLDSYLLLFSSPGP